MRELRDERAKYGISMGVLNILIDFENLALLKFFGFLYYTRYRVARISNLTRMFRFKNSLTVGAFKKQFFKTNLSLPAFAR